MAQSTIKTASKQNNFKLVYQSLTCLENNRLAQTCTTHRSYLYSCSAFKQQINLLEAENLWLLRLRLNGNKEQSIGCTAAHHICASKLGTGNEFTPARVRWGRYTDPNTSSLQHNLIKYIKQMNSVVWWLWNTYQAGGMLVILGEVSHGSYKVMIVGCAVLIE